TADITTMPPYSDRRKNANFRPVYSVYAPKMISESATGMSNGGRVSSATADIMNTMNSGNSGTMYHTVRCASTRPIIDVEAASMTAAAAASTSGSSQAISCAAARNAPISENLFAEAHPAISTPRTPIEDIASTKKMPMSRFSAYRAVPNGITRSTTRYGTSAPPGAIENPGPSAAAGTMSSFWMN